MAQLARISLAGTAVVAGGIGLGTLLSAFVQPVPIAPPPAPWASGHLQIAAATPNESPAYYGSLPQEVIPPHYAADEGPVWAEPAGLDDTGSEAESAAPGEPAQLQPAEYTDLADRTIAAPPYRRWEDSAAPAPAPDKVEADAISAEPDADPAILIVPVDPIQPPPSEIR